MQQIGRRLRSHSWLIYAASPPPLWCVSNPLALKPERPCMTLCQHERALCLGGAPSYRSSGLQSCSVQGVLVIVLWIMYKTCYISWMPLLLTYAFLCSEWSRCCLAFFSFFFFQTGCIVSAIPCNRSSFSWSTWCTVSSCHGVFCNTSYVMKRPAILAKCYLTRRQERRKLHKFEICSSFFWAQMTWPAILSYTTSKHWSCCLEIKGSILGESRRALCW